MDKLTNVKGIILDYGATIDSNGKHWSEVIWEGYCQMSLPVTKEQFREAYIFAERYIQITPTCVNPDDNFYQLMQTRVGIQLDLMISQGWLSEENFRTALRMASEGEMPILDNISELSEHFSNVIAGYCYDFARRCTLDAIPIIEHLSCTYPLALVSNFYGNLRSVLQDFGLLRCFEVVVDSAEAGVRKPSTDIYQLAISQLGCAAEEVLVIGDSYSKDIEPALRLGCQAVQIKGQGWESDTAGYEPSITSLIQLYDIL